MAANNHNSLHVSRILTLVVALFHLVIGLGIGWGIGPVEYDPEVFFFGGKPGSLLVEGGGMERLFPRLLGCFYASIAGGLLYGAAINNTTDSIRSSLVVSICYHFGAATDAINLFRDDAGAINTNKMDPMEPFYGHAMLFTLSLISFVLAGSIGNNNHSNNNNDTSAGGSKED